MREPLLTLDQLSIAAGLGIDAVMADIENELLCPVSLKPPLMFTRKEFNAYLEYRRTTSGSRRKREYAKSYTDRRKQITAALRLYPLEKVAAMFKIKPASLRRNQRNWAKQAARAKAKRKQAGARDDS